ncbi:MAG: hypothetical protein CME72_11000 [Halomonadaceae bacterium]|nr:hypothetical protein [Halomonadaceae bacterium]
MGGATIQNPAQTGYRQAMNFVINDQELLKATVETVREAVLITDSRLAHPGPAILYANPAFLELTGYTAEELLGQTPALLQGKEADGGVMQTLRQQLSVGSAGEVLTGETVNYRKDGRPFCMEWTIRPFPAAGEPRYFIASLRDVSAIRNLEQQRQQLQTLAEIQTRVSTAGLDLQALRDRVADIARAVTGADGAAIEEPEDSEMVYTATSGRAAGSPGIRLPISGSLSGLCYRQHESIYCRDTHEDTRVARDVADQVGFRSGFLVPLVHQEHCFGVLKVYSGRPHAFNEGDLQLLNMASHVLASSLSDARLFKGERDRRSLLVDSLPIMISYVDNQLRYVEINVAYNRWYNLPTEQLVGRRVAEVMGQEAFESNRPYMLSALAGERVTFESRYTHPDGTVTPVEVDYTPVRNSHGDVQGFFSMVRDISDLKRAEQDYLTGAFNRQGFDDRLAISCATARRYSRPLSLIFLDLDHFKSINDNHGHAVGDDVLRGVAKTLQNEVRDSDIVSRWGGEEFAILTPETSLQDALALAERLRQALYEHPYAAVGRISASFGVAAFDPEEAERDFVRRVDEALYKAKVSGRNQVQQAGPLSH